MAFLNAQERAALHDQLKDMKFSQARNKLARLDPKGRLVFYRNNQRVGQWQTRYDLEGLGTRVTLVEALTETQGLLGRRKSDYAITDVVVEPLSGNRT
jgi:hypothetical protein